MGWKLAILFQARWVSGAPILFVSWQSSRYLREDQFGLVHSVDQGEGGEQGDALMPLLFALGQRVALEAVQSRLLEGERLFAFLGDEHALITVAVDLVLFV